MDDPTKNCASYAIAPAKDSVAKTFYTDEITIDDQYFDMHSGGFFDFDLVFHPLTNKSLGCSRYVSPETKEQYEKNGHNKYKLLVDIENGLEPDYDHDFTGVVRRILKKGPYQQDQAVILQQGREHARRYFASLVEKLVVKLAANGNVSVSEFSSGSNGLHESVAKAVRKDAALGVPTSAEASIATIPKVAIDDEQQQRPNFSSSFSGESFRFIGKQASLQKNPLEASLSRRQSFRWGTCNQIKSPTAASALSNVMTLVSSKLETAADVSSTPSAANSSNIKKMATTSPSTDVKYSGTTKVKEPTATAAPFYPGYLATTISQGKKSSLKATPSPATDESIVKGENCALATSGEQPQSISDPVALLDKRTKLKYVAYNACHEPGLINGPKSPSSTTSSSEIIELEIWGKTSKMNEVHELRRESSWAPPSMASPLAISSNRSPESAAPDDKSDYPYIPPHLHSHDSYEPRRKKFASVAPSQPSSSVSSSSGGNANSIPSGQPVSSANLLVTSRQDHPTALKPRKSESSSSVPLGSEPTTANSRHIGGNYPNGSGSIGPALLAGRDLPNYNSPRTESPRLPPGYDASRAGRWTQATLWRNISNDTQAFMAEDKKRPSQKGGIVPKTAYREPEFGGSKDSDHCFPERAALEQRYTDDFVRQTSPTLNPNAIGSRDDGTTLKAKPSGSREVKSATNCPPAASAKVTPQHRDSMTFARPHYYTPRISNKSAVELTVASGNILSPKIHSKTPASQYWDLKDPSDSEASSRSSLEVMLDGRHKLVLPPEDCDLPLFYTSSFRNHYIREWRLDHSIAGAVDMKCPDFTPLAKPLDNTQFFESPLLGPVIPDIANSENVVKQKQQTSETEVKQKLQIWARGGQAWKRGIPGEAIRDRKMVFQGPEPDRFGPTIDIHLRPANMRDANQMVAIYNHYVENTHIPEDQESITAQEFSVFIEMCQREMLPIIVAVTGKIPESRNVRGRAAVSTKSVLLVNEQVVGFATAEMFNYGWGGSCRGRSRATANLSLYVSPVFVRKGVGRNLMDRLLVTMRSTYSFRDACEWINPNNDPAYHPGGTGKWHQLIVQLPVLKDDDPNFNWVKAFLAKFYIVYDHTSRSVARTSSKHSGTKFIDLVVFQAQALQAAEY